MLLWALPTANYTPRVSLEGSGPRGIRLVLDQGAKLTYMHREYQVPRYRFVPYCPVAFTSPDAEIAHEGKHRIGPTHGQGQRQNATTSATKKNKPSDESVTHSNKSHIRTRYTSESVTPDTVAQPNPLHSRIRCTPESVTQSNPLHTGIHFTFESVPHPNPSDIRIRHTPESVTHQIPSNIRFHYLQTPNASRSATPIYRKLCNSRECTKQSKKLTLPSAVASFAQKGSEFFPLATSSLAPSSALSI